MLDFLSSRGFWTLVLAITPPMLQLFGVTDESTTTAILSIVGALAGYFGVTAVRVAKQEPRSYRKALKEGG